MLQINAKTEKESSQMELVERVQDTIDHQRTRKAVYKILAQKGKSFWLTEDAKCVLNIQEQRISISAETISAAIDRSFFQMANASHVKLTLSHQRRK